MTDASLPDTLVNVRKAVRLLHDFNQRIFDMVQDVDKFLDGYSFEAIWNLSEPLTKWNPQDTEVDYWKTLPFSSMGFLWIRRAQAEKMGITDRLFGIQITADDQLLEDEEDVRKWPSPETGSSSISFFLGHPTDEMAKFDAVKIFDNFFFKTPMTRLLSNRKRTYHVYNTMDLETVATKSQVQKAISEFLPSAESILLAP